MKNENSRSDGKEDEPCSCEMIIHQAVSETNRCTVSVILIKRRCRAIVRLRKSVLIDRERLSEAGAMSKRS